MKTIPFDWFIDTVPEVIELVQQAEKRGWERGKAKGKAQGEAKGKVEGELQTLRQIALDIIEDRFPVLIDFARLEITAVMQPSLLYKLIRDLYKAPDENKAFQMLKQVKKGA